MCFSLESGVDIFLNTFLDPKNKKYFLFTGLVLPMRSQCQGKLGFGGYVWREAPGDSQLFILDAFVLSTKGGGVSAAST